MSARRSKPRSPKREELERISRFSEEWALTKRLSGEIKQFRSQDEAIEACKQDYLKMRGLTEAELAKLIDVIWDEESGSANEALMRMASKPMPNPYNLMVQCALCGRSFPRSGLCECMGVSRHDPVLPGNPWDLLEKYRSADGVHTAPSKPACEKCGGNKTILTYGTEGGIVEEPCKECGGER